MGHGASRELETEDELKELTPTLSAKLSEALQRMDAVDADFRAQRTEERQSQLSKIWGRKCRDIMDDMRMLARVMHAEHQLSFDSGSDGGGKGTRPWMEDISGKFERLYLRLEESEQVLATMGDQPLARGQISDIDYAWLEKVVVIWVLKSVETKTRGVGAPRLG